MTQSIDYQPGVDTTSSITIPSAFAGATETDLFILADTKYVRASQLTIMGSVTLGGVTSVTFYYYYSPDSGTTWYPVSLYNTSSGEMTRRSVLLDSGTGTYPVSTHSRFVDNVPLGAATQFKITGVSASGTPTLDSLHVFIRNN